MKHSPPPGQGGDISYVVGAPAVDVIGDGAPDLSTAFVAAQLVIVQGCPGANE